MIIEVGWKIQVVCARYTFGSNVSISKVEVVMGNIASNETRPIPNPVAKACSAIA